MNALSEHMDVKIFRDGQIYHDAYERGIPVVELENGLLPVIGKTRQTGTEINFLPDGEIFEKTKFKAEWLKSRIHETAYLNPGLTINYTNKRAGEEESIVYAEPEGIVAYVKELNTGKTRSMIRSILRDRWIRSRWRWHFSLWIPSRRIF